MILRFKKWLEASMGQSSMGKGDVSNNGLLRTQIYRPTKKRSKRAEKIFGVKGSDIDK